MKLITKETVTAQPGDDGLRASPPSHKVIRKMSVKKKRCKTNVVLAVAALLAALSGYAGPDATAAGLTLAVDGNTTYRIVISEQADESTKAVAEDMAAILKEITGAVFPVVADTEAPLPNEIVVGHDNARLTDLALAGMTKEFALDEYEIRTVGTRLVIAGTPPRGSINGMYGFLQDHLGCRWFTPAASRIPRNPDLAIGGIADRQRPDFLWRTAASVSYWDADWSARNRMNRSLVAGGTPAVGSTDARLYSMLAHYGGHGLNYVPASLHDEHPEYYAEIDGKRALHESASQRAYCITNPGFVKYIIEWSKDQFRGQVGRYGYAPIINLGHTDNHLYCQCTECETSYERLGEGDIRVGIAGTYHEFYNKIAAEVVKEYPDAIIDIIAYSIVGFPSSVMMHPNIQVTWTPIGACQAHAFDECPANRDNDLLGWLDKWVERTEMVHVWLYHYQNYPWMPHLKLFAAPRNLREFHRRGVHSVIIQSPEVAARTNPASDGDKVMGGFNPPNNVYWTVTDNLRHLISYLCTRLLWDTNYDIREGITEFCETYYGAASSEMDQVIVLLQSVSSYERTMGTTFSAYAGVHQPLSSAPLLKWNLVEKMDGLFDAAEKNVADDAVRLRRVQMLRLTHQMGILCYAAADDPLRTKAFDAFFPLVEELGIKTFHNTGLGGGATPAEFKALVSDPENILIPGQEKVGANLLRNSSFEKSTFAYRVPDEWSAEGAYLPEDYKFDENGLLVDTTTAYSGKASVRMTKKPSPGRTVGLRQRFDVQPGKRYRMNIRYRADIKQGGFYIVFSALDKDGKFLRHYSANRGVKNTDGKWQFLEVATGIKDDTVFMWVEAILYDDSAEGVVWIDDFTCAMIDE